MQIRNKQKFNRRTMPEIPRNKYLQKVVEHNDRNAVTIKTKMRALIPLIRAKY